MPRTSTCFLIALAAASALLASCHRGPTLYAKDIPPRAVVRDGVAVTLSDQKLTVFKQGKKVKDYSISSSKFGIGSKDGSRRTPLGIHAVSSKTGEGQPKGMVFKSCRPTGEVLDVDAPGRDPIVTRVIQLAGLEKSNSTSHQRRIYIHGTPEERYIGRPASYGCIRMKSDDIVDLYSRVHRGMPVAIESCTQQTYLKAEQDFTKNTIAVPSEMVAQLPRDGFKATGRRMAPRRASARRSTGLARSGKGRTFKKRNVRSRSRLALRKRNR